MQEEPPVPNQQQPNGRVGHAASEPGTSTRPEVADLETSRVEGLRNLQEALKKTLNGVDATEQAQLQRQQNQEASIGAQAPQGIDGSTMTSTEPATATSSRQRRAPWNLVGKWTSKGFKARK